MNCIALLLCPVYDRRNVISVARLALIFYQPVALFQINMLRLGVAMYTYEMRNESFHASSIMVVLDSTVMNERCVYGSV
jgi:hypothetical protein